MRSLLFFIVLIFPLLAQAQVKFFNTFGNGIYDTGEGVLQAPDTGYVVAGITTPTGSNGTDMLLYKTDSMGALQWWKNIGGTGTQGAKSIARAVTGSGYLLAGYENILDTSGYNVCLTHTDLNGNVIWKKSYGGSDWEMAYSVDTLKDSSYIVAGETFSFGNGNLDMYVLKIDMNGDTIWTRTFGGTEDDYARYVYVDRHGKIMVIGTTKSFGAGGADVYMVYLKPDGDTIWTKTYGDANDQYGYSGDMYIDNGNGMAFGFGYTSYYPPSDAQEAYFLRVDSTGANVIQNVGILISNPEIIDHIKIRKDGRGKFYYAADKKYAADGKTDIFLNRTYYGFGFSYYAGVFDGTDDEMPKDIRKCFDFGYVITGEIQSYGPGPTATFIMKTDSTLSTVATPLVSTEEEILNDFMVYPNPAQAGNTLYIQCEYSIESVRLYNMAGQIVYTQSPFLQGIPVMDVPDGMYILEVNTTKGTGRKKVLITR